MFVKHWENGPDIIIFTECIFIAYKRIMFRKLYHRIGKFILETPIMRLGA